MKSLKIVATLACVFLSKCCLAQDYYHDTFYYSKASLIFIPVEINHIKVRALIDAGSYKGIEVSSRLADSLHLSLADTKNIAVRYTGSAKELQGSVDNFRLGTLNLTHQTISVVRNDIETISNQIKTTFDVILGWGFLSNYLLTIDYKNKSFLLGAPENKIENNFKSQLNFTIINHLPVLTGVIGDRTLKILFDTGAPICKLDSSFSSSLNSFIDRTVLISDHKFLMKFKVQSLTPIKNTLGCEAVIGNNFLDSYRVVVSPKAGKIYLYD